MKKKIMISVGIILAAAGLLAALALLLPKTDPISEIEDTSTSRQIVPKSDEPNTIMETDLSALDFTALRSINPDIVAWIKVAGTDISYPVLRTGDDKPEDFYLHHDIYGRYSFKGSIYMQNRNHADLSDFMTVLYGHNMNDRSMFRQLHRLRNPDYLKENNGITVYTPDGDKHYHIISATIQSDENILDAYDDFEDKDIRVGYWKSLFDEEEIGQLLVLSTCCGDTDRRLVVVSKACT